MTEYINPEKSVKTNLFIQTTNEGTKVKVMDGFEKFVNILNHAIYGYLIKISKAGQLVPESYIQNNYIKMENSIDLKVCMSYFFLII